MEWEWVDEEVGEEDSRLGSAVNAHDRQIIRNSLTFLVGGAGTKSALLKLV
jgi:hypothetical protein